MKIKAICENIRKADFYDFYLLQYINATSTMSHIASQETERYFKYLVDFILEDHLLQLSKIALNRLPDIDHKETSELIASYGLKLDEFYNYEGLESLTLKDRSDLLIKIVGYNRSHGFTGKTWLWIGRTAIKLIRVYYNGNLTDKVNAIDEIYNLLHHGGKVSDYMDESNWLEDALNIRDNSNIRYIFSRASSYAKKLIGRPTFSNDDNINVTEIDKLYTAFVRLTHKEIYSNGIDFKRQGNKLTISVNATIVMMDYGTEFKSSPWVVYGGVITKQIQKMIDYKDGDKQKFLLGENKTNTTVIEELDDRLVITGEHNSVSIYKPINRHLQLATDTVLATTYDRPFTTGIGMIQFKKSYYYIDGRLKQVHDDIPN